ncbi:matrix metalloproteinase-14-like [Watersipora subatra]|uniref:matrix metalloproteinase-14-like n=1 Tax=Watersipora subatra TaxID=2589382 RepID=UPI00355AE202
MALYLIVLVYCVLPSTLCYDNAFEAMDYLMRYGYLAPPDPHTGNLASYADYEKAIVDFQSMAGLEATGVMNNSTLEMMNRPRCGVSDKMGTNRFSHRKRRYALQGSKWFSQNLTYHIANYTHRLQKDTIEEHIHIAIQMWTEFANITFSKVNSTTADIVFVFANRTHNDGYPFDGEGGVLAHAFFPERGGDVHFDDSEKWIVGTASQGIDLLFTAAHELGHSLGLSHSDNINSIMAPIYRASISRQHQLHPDDMRAIQSLYGSRGFDIGTTTPYEHGTSEGHYDICMDPVIDGVTTTQDLSTYFYKGDFYWRFVIGKRLWQMVGYPKRIDSSWNEVEGAIDSVYTTHNGSTFFFKGDRYWEYVNRRFIANGSIADKFVGLPSNIDAIFTWSGNGKTYAIKGSRYYMIQENWHVAAGYPKDMSIWQGLPYARIDAAIGFGGNTRTYFFSGGDYYRFNDRLLQVTFGSAKFT